MVHTYGKAGKAMITIEKYSGVFENHFAITSNFSSLQRAMQGELHTFILKSKVFSVKKIKYFKRLATQKEPKQFFKIQYFC